MDNQKRREIRSYSLRQGRMTQGQQLAINQFWARYGIDNDDTALSLETVFGRSAFTVVEIGFGSGESLTTMAAARPECNFLGIEVHGPGIGQLLMRAEAMQLSNLRVIRDDAVTVLERRIADQSLDRLQLFFPDPWPKRRHHKRRIVQPRWIQQVARKLKPGGHLHIATDWEHYARQMLAMMEASGVFANATGQGRFADRPGYRPLTHFERRGQALGHSVWDLLFERS